ncbi:hypothetical protein ABZP36_012113 [Zizania latifolia]
MAAAAVEKLKALWDSQVNDEEKWAFNYVSSSLIPSRKSTISFSFSSSYAVSCKRSVAVDLGRPYDVML